MKKAMPLSSYMGMVESFSSYQALLKEDPEEAGALSNRITNKWVSPSTSLKPTAQQLSLVYAILICIFLWVGLGEDRVAV